MIEGEALRAVMLDEFGLGGIVARYRSGIAGVDQVGRRDAVAPRIAVRPLVNSNKPQDFPFDPGFLAQLPQRRFLHSLAVFHKAAGQRVLALKGRVFTANKEQASGLVEDDAVGRKRGLLMHQGRLETS
jgi:hypothetical protein